MTDTRRNRSGTLALGFALLGLMGCKREVPTPGTPTPQFLAGQEKYQAAVGRMDDAARLLKERKLDGAAAAYLAAIQAANEICDGGIPGAAGNRGPVYDGKWVADWRSEWVSSFMEDARSSYTELDGEVATGALEESVVRRFYQAVDPTTALRWRENHDPSNPADAHAGEWIVGCAGTLPCPRILAGEVLTALTTWVGGKLEAKETAVTEAEADQRDGVLTLSLYAPPHRYRVDQTGMPLVETGPRHEPETQLSVVVYASRGFRAPARVKTFNRAIPGFVLDTTNEQHNEDRRVEGIRRAILEALARPEGAR